MKIPKIKKNCRIKINYIYTRVKKDLTKLNENIRNKTKFSTFEYWVFEKVR